MTAKQTTRYHLSEEWLARARKVTPLGAQTRSKAAQGFCEGAFPAVLTDADGPYVWDVDGNKYTDFIMGLGAVGIGHECVARDWMFGAVVPSYSLPHLTEIRYAEALTQALGFDMVRFVKTGSEATEAAMRIARVVTGRSGILSIGYHGWHSVHDSARGWETTGVPYEMTQVISSLDYNKTGALKQALVSGKMAGVLVEPVLHIQPSGDYLQNLRELCGEYGTLLIFDEVVSGFRWALGGAGEYFGVKPDLACFGKAMANGWPLACVLGSREIMEEGGKYISGTFGGEVFSLTQALRTLQRYQQEKVIDAIWGAGRILQTGFNGVAETTGAPYRMDGFPCKPYIRVTTDDEDKKLISLLLQEAAARGVLLHPTSLCVSASHSPEVINETVGALGEAMQAVVSGVKLKGLPSRPVFKRV